MEDPLPPQTLTGSCFCGRIRYLIDLGIPVTATSTAQCNEKDKKEKIISRNLTLSAYCHCTNCQRLNGSPFVWTTHWKREAIQWQDLESNSNTITAADGVQVRVPDTLDLFEAMPGRKFKLRCNRCGSPMGSYSIFKHEWTIWGVSIDRNPQSSHQPSQSSGTAIHGWQLIKPIAHQFYGTRILDIHDELSKWEGYEGSSLLLSNSKNP